MPAYPSDQPRPPPTWPALLLAVPLVLVGILAKAIRPRPGFRHRVSDPVADRELGNLRSRVVGKSKTDIAEQLGALRTAFLLETVPPAALTQPMYLHASTWYYPLNVGDRSVMAIQFEGDVARTVEFFQTGEGLG